MRYITGWQELLAKRETNIYLIVTDPCWLIPPKKYCPMNAIRSNLLKSFRPDISVYVA